jgi:pyridoxal phosphate enzyme (YggS family)
MARPRPQSQVATEVAANLAEVTARIAAAAQRAGRRADEITLIAVSKTFGPERIRPVLEAGHRFFGENRVQEAEKKWPGLKADYPDATLHLIGPLQTNKARAAVELFDVIETVDRAKLARVLAQEMARADKRVPCYVQVNTGAEPQKGGVLPEQADALIAACRDELGLSLAGLMCIPPFEEEAALHFALLGEIARRNGLKGLSMGMSGDYEMAIEFGATAVRVGSAIFGPRTGA